MGPNDAWVLDVGQLGRVVDHFTSNNHLQQLLRLYPLSRDCGYVDCGALVVYQPCSVGSLVLGCSREMVEPCVHQSWQEVPSRSQ